MTKGKLVIIYTRRARAACEIGAELHITFRRMNANLINFFTEKLAKFRPDNVSSNHINI